jgi:hypothetical protein
MTTYTVTLRINGANFTYVNVTQDELVNLAQAAEGSATMTLVSAEVENWGVPA